MKQKLLLLLMMYSISTILNVAQSQNVSGRSLRVIVQEKYPNGNVFVGCAAHSTLKKPNPELTNILNREFNYVTPANDFKQITIHPEPNTWNWTLVDQWAKETKLHGQVIRAHCPISPQCSNWAKEDNRTKEELLQNLEEYMTEQCKRYAKIENIHWMDVVNETIDKDGNWFGPKEGTDKWENPWTIIGFDSDSDKTPLYISKAFEISNREVPNIKQLINEHALTDASVEKMKQLVIYLRGKKLKVDGICWQGHIESGWENESGNVSRLDNFITWAHKNKLEFHITEFQATIRKDKERQTKWNKNPQNVSEDELKKRMPDQANTFSAVLRTLLMHRNTGIIGINFWHLTDNQSQIKDGNMFNEDGTPRPSYYAVRELLENPPIVN